MAVRGGAPPDDHARQCKARSMVTRKRCKRWALRGSDNCQFHGGRMSAAYRFKKGIYNVSGIYSKYLGPILTERVREAVNEPHDEQVSLYQELAITRSVACEALKLARPMFDPDLRKQIDDETAAMCMTTLNSAMASVKDLVLAAARIEKDSKDKVSIKVINLIVAQIITAVQDECGEEHESLAESIAQAIDKKVRLPMNDKANQVIEIDVS